MDKKSELIKPDRQAEHINKLRTKKIARHQTKQTSIQILSVAMLFSFRKIKIDDVCKINFLYERKTHEIKLAQ